MNTTNNKNTAESLEGFREFRITKKDLLDKELLYLKEPHRKVCFGIRLANQCKYCETEIPVNAITSSITCSHCHKENELTEQWWKKVFTQGRIQEAFTRRKGVGTSAKWYSSTHNEHMQCRRVDPHCVACNSSLPKGSIYNLKENEELKCNSCVKTISLRPATDLSKKLFPGAQFIIGEGSHSIDNFESANNKNKTPIVFKCMTCGSNLDLDGNSRNVNCNYCDADNYLPDDAWLRLHPVYIVREFYVVADIGLNKQTQWLTQDNEIAKTIALSIVNSKQDLHPELVNRLVNHKNDEVRQVAANFEQLTKEQCSQLAKDKEWRVKQKITQRHDLSELLSHIELLSLASSRDNDINKSILNNKSFPLQMIANDIPSQGDLEYLLPRLARHPDTSVEIITWLAKHAKDAIVSIVKSHSKYVEPSFMDRIKSRFKN